MEENMQGKKIGLVLFVFLIVMGSIGIFYIDSKKNTTDAKKFKEEYESLNNKIRESDGALYNTVTIPEKNPIKYVTAQEATNIIKNKTGILYFGTNWCPWSRNAVEVLFSSASQNNLDTSYYVDMDFLRNVWDIKDGKLIKTQKEQEGYYELLAALEEILGEDTYVLKDEEGKTYDTGEKRIYMPLVVSVKNGTIMKNHVGTISLEEGQTKYDKLKPNQYEELQKIYNALIQSIRSTSCTLENACG